MTTFSLPEDAEVALLWAENDFFFFCSVQKEEVPTKGGVGLGKRNGARMKGADTVQSRSRGDRALAVGVSGGEAKKKPEGFLPLSLF